MSTVEPEAANHERAAESRPVQGRRSTQVSIERIVGNARADALDETPVEEPLEVRLEPHGQPSRALTVTMRTPGHDAELAAGFLLTEGVLEDAGVIAALRVGVEEAQPAVDALVTTRGSVVTVVLRKGAVIRTASLERNFYTTSSCGVCGKASLLALRSICPVRRPNRLRLPTGLLYGLAERMRAAQDVFDRTGGLHAAALFGGGGELLLLREDVGRHNAVDKVIGERFLADETPLRDHILLLSGRVSFDLMQKAVLAGIPAVAAIGAPSSMAVAMAREFDVTLIGFLRGERCNIYHGAERVITDGV